MALVLVAAITIAATLESVFAYCLGCKVFALLMRVGVIPPEVCEACNDLSLRASDAPRANSRDFPPHWRLPASSDRGRDSG